MLYMQMLCVILIVSNNLIILWYIYIKYKPPVWQNSINRHCSKDLHEMNHVLEGVIGVICAPTVTLRPTKIWPMIVLNACPGDFIYSAQWSIRQDIICELPIRDNYIDLTQWTKTQERQTVQFRHVWSSGNVMGIFVTEVNLHKLSYRKIYITDNINKHVLLRDSFQ